MGILTPGRVEEMSFKAWRLVFSPERQYKCEAVDWLLSEIDSADCQLFELDSASTSNKGATDTEKLPDSAKIYLGYFTHLEFWSCCGPRGGSYHYRDTVKITRRKLHTHSPLCAP